MTSAYAEAPAVGEVVEQVGKRGVEVFTRSLDGTLLAIFTDKWWLRTIEREYPDVMLTPLLAAGAAG